MRAVTHVRSLAAAGLSLMAGGGAKAADPAGATEHPPRQSIDVEAADLDRDGHVDFVYLIGGDAPSLRILHGGPAGFRTDGRDEAPLAAAGSGAASTGDLKIVDLNADGRPDIVVTAGGRAAAVWWNRNWSGRTPLRDWPRTPLATERPSAVAAGDFDRDGLADLLVDGVEPRVFWGAPTRTFVTRPATPVADVNKPAAVAIAPNLPAAPPQPRPVPGAEHVVLHREAGRYSAFPSLYHVRGPREALHVHFGAGETTSHVESRRQDHDFISVDGGRTWQRTTQRATNPAWRSTHSARLVDASPYGWRHVPREQRADLEAQGYEVRNAPDGRVTYCAGCRVRTSDDGGATWQERELAVPGQAIINGYHDAAATLRLDDRTLLRAVFGKPAARVRYYESWLLRSEDDGATWTFGTIAADNSRDDRGFSETALAQAGNGDIVAMMRIEPPMGTNLWVARSSDRGKTWSKAEETPLRGFPAHLLRLRDGRLLCTYGHREAPIGIRAAISRDDGRTWLEKDIVTLRSDGSGPPSDNGYPLTAQLSDGTLVTVHYLTREGITGIEATRWTDPWK